MILKMKLTLVFKSESEYSTEIITGATSWRENYFIYSKETLNIRLFFFNQLHIKLAFEAGKISVHLLFD